MTVYNVTIGYKGAPLPVETIQTVQGVLGWARYAPNCWFFTSNLSAQQLAENIRKVVPASDSVFVTTLAGGPASYGFLQQEIWDWLKNNPPKS